jgi:hypothetical protein
MRLICGANHVAFQISDQARMATILIAASESGMMDSLDSTLFSWPANV